MQRIALLLLCTGLGSSSAQADFCERVGQVIAGFAGGATGYGLVRNLGSATNWVSAGLYGAGITVVGIGGQTAGQEICENFDDLLNDIMAISGCPGTRCSLRIASASSSNRPASSVSSGSSAS